MESLVLFYVVVWLVSAWKVLGSSLFLVLSGGVCPSHSSVSPSLFYAFPLSDDAFLLLHQNDYPSCEQNVTAAVGYCYWGWSHLKMTF